MLGLLGTTALAADQAKSADQADKQSFELTPAAPPIPALKYQLMFDDAGDRLPGNAAILYLDSVLLLNADTREKIQQCGRRPWHRQDGVWRRLPIRLKRRRRSRKWSWPVGESNATGNRRYREMGAETLLPHLEPMVRGIGRLLWVRAQRQIEQGKTEEAIKTIRLGYEMSDKIGREGDSGVGFGGSGCKRNDGRLCRAVGEPA